MPYTYKMIQLPSKLVVKAGQNRETFAAQTLEEMVNSMAEQGWEFERLDPYTVEQPPGCLAGLFGQSATQMIYNIATFKRPRD